MGELGSWTTGKISIIIIRVLNVPALSLDFFHLISSSISSSLNFSADDESSALPLSQRTTSLRFIGEHVCPNYRVLMLSQHEEIVDKILETMESFAANAFNLTSLELKLAGSLPFLKKFTHKEIERATDGFRLIIGSDSHGTIYKAQFPDGLVAAVKKRSNLRQGKDTFFREVQLLGRLHHRHLVGFQGFSEGRDSVRFLIFDHMEIGSLKECLHDPLRTPLTWRIRLQIAIDIAAALEYLYYFCDPPVYIVSINSNNVLLGEDFVAKLADVGFRDTDCGDAKESNVTPSQDYIEKRRRDAVFQFGALILELVTGQSLGDEDELVQWVQESGFAYSMHKMVDADLGDNYDSKELKSLLIIARLCTRNTDEPVISIPQILRYLQGKVEYAVPSV